jgi:hypothetical protein
MLLFKTKGPQNSAETLFMAPIFQQQNDRYIIELLKDGKTIVYSCQGIILLRPFSSLEEFIS